MENVSRDPTAPTYTEQVTTRATAEAERAFRGRIERLQTFVKRVHDECHKHIMAGESDRGKLACGDCPVWTLRAEATEVAGGDRVVE